MKKNVALLMSGSSNLISSIASVIINAEAKSPGLVDDVIVYHDNISEADQKALNKFRQVKFIKFQNILTENKKTANNDYFGFLCFGVFEIFNLLKEYKNVIYLDSDVVIKKDFSDILNYGPLGMINNNGTKIFDCFKSPPKDIEKNFHTRNSGVIIANDSLNYEGLTDYCYKKTLEQWDNNIFADQAMLAYCFLLKNIKINNLPAEYNSIFGKNDKDIIVHCINGSRKTWNNTIVNRAHIEWNDYYEKWIELGGSPSESKLSNIFFNKINYQSHKDLEIISKVYLKYMTNLLLETHEKILPILNNNFIKIRSNKELPTFYYEFNSKDIIRFELMLRSMSIYLKIYTTNADIKEKIFEKYSKEINGFKINNHSDKKISVSFEKTYHIFDYLNKLDEVPNIIKNDATYLFTNTLLKEDI